MASAYMPPGDPTEVLGRRAVAFAIDAALLFVIGLTLFALLRYRAYTNVEVDLCSRLSKADSGAVCLKLGSRAFLWHKGALKLSVLVVLFLGFLDGVVLQSITGSTVGKFCTRLSVVNEHGLKAHPLRMFGRWVMLVIDLGFLLVGCIVTGASHPHRRLGDFAFGTYVVSMSSVGRPIEDWLKGGVPSAAGNAMPSVGEPASWSEPPVPVAAAALAEPAPPLAPPPPAAPPTPARPVPAVEAVQTPPGTAPTTPGEWGAVARPAPLVRSPQWATPPPSDKPKPPSDATPGSTPWAAPPTKRDDDKSTVSGPPPAGSDSESDAQTAEKGDAGSTNDVNAEVDAEVDAPPEVKSDAKADADSDTKADAKNGAQPDAKTDGKPDAKSDAKSDAKADTQNGAQPDAKSDATTEVEAKAATASDPEVALELEAELGDDDETTSQWKPVESASARNRGNSAVGPADASWWDEALSSGESENGTDPKKSE